MIGMNLVTAQTGPKAGMFKRFWLKKAWISARNYTSASSSIGRPEGRYSWRPRPAEWISKKSLPRLQNSFLRNTSSRDLDCSRFRRGKLAFGIGIAPELINDAVQFMMALYKAFEETDASLAEINPFLVTGDNKVYALDAKMNFDDNALYRHKDIKELRDLNEEDPLEIEASKFGLNYIKLDGNVACMVNGAGLAMATMDIIKTGRWQSGELP